MKEIKAEGDSLDSSEKMEQFKYDREISHSHCVMHYKILQNRHDCTTCTSKSQLDVQSSNTESGSSINNGCGTEQVLQEIQQNNLKTSIESLSEFIEKMTIKDIDFCHTYSEGLAITVADLILYTYIYYLLVRTICAFSLNVKSRINNKYK